MRVNKMPPTLSPREIAVPGGVGVRPGEVFTIQNAYGHFYMDPRAPDRPQRFVAVSK